MWSCKHGEDFKTCEDCKADIRKLTRLSRVQQLRRQKLLDKIALESQEMGLPY